MRRATSTLRPARRAAAALVALVLAAPAATAADAPLVDQDREDLLSFCVDDTPLATERIESRFDRLIDSAVAALADDARERAVRGAKGSRRAADAPERRKDAGDKGPPAADGRELTSAALAWRLSRLFEAMPRGDRAALWQRLESAMPFAMALAFTYDPTGDQLDEVAMLASRLVGEDGANVERYPALAAALCVVFDAGPPSAVINRNRASAPTADLAWRHFVSNASRMRYGLDIAPELLVHVVDARAPADELAWALATFGQAPRVGALYSKVEYDYGVLEGRAMKSSLAGWSLPNIFRHGGVCADQAHFASTVAKAIGVPAAYTVGQDTSSSHAWVGFAHTVGTVTGWDVEGRYDSYRGVEGRIMDPQTRRLMPDAVMPMLVQWGLEPARDRLRASVLRTMDERLLERVAGPARRADDSGGEADGRQAEHSAPGTDRAAVDAMRETVLRSALRLTPTDVRTWRRVQRLGADRSVDEATMRQWLDGIVDLCGRAYPEMVVEVAVPLIQSVPAGDGQHALWRRLAEVVASRQDLGARVLYLDGRMWERERDLRKAGKAYEEVISRFPDGGTSMQAALGRAANIVRSARDSRRLVALYDKAFARMAPPKDFPGIFGRYSTWYAVGSAYADVLREVGRPADADALRARIDAYLSAKGS